MSSTIRTKEDRWFVDFIVDNYKPPSEAIGDRDINVPPCQREWAWKGAAGLKKQQGFVDSIMSGYPVPSCIVNRIGPMQFYVYDGRHRMETLWRYANNKFEWNSKKFSDLTLEEQRRFKNRELPVTITDNATTHELAEMFIRLNKGVPLKDYDLLHANASSKLVNAVYRLVYTHDSLADALALTDGKIRQRGDLANWAALVSGLNTETAGNMTTSFIRLSDCGLDSPIDDTKVTSGLDALAKLYTRANTEYPTDDKTKRTYKKIGKLTAFFVADWLDCESEDTVIEKWVKVIGKMRGTKEESREMNNALATKGAQNLTHTKVKKVIEQVNAYLYENRGAEALDDYDNDDDSTD